MGGAFSISHRINLSDSDLFCFNFKFLIHNYFSFRSVLDIHHGVCSANRRIVTNQYHGLIGQRFYIHGDKTIHPACNKDLQLAWTYTTPFVIYLTADKKPIYEFKIIAPLIAPSIAPSSSTHSPQKVLLNLY